MDGARVILGDGRITEQLGKIDETSAGKAITPTRIVWADPIDSNSPKRGQTEETLEQAFGNIEPKSDFHLSEVLFFKNKILLWFNSI